MIAPISTASNIAATSLEDDDRWRVVQHVLTSPIFANAPRMRALLSFLMTRKISGLEGTINEYTIGIEVFRRDARDYDTTIDPVVRVQMGRLRERLARYYDVAGDKAGPRIAIPAGTYVPVWLVATDTPANVRRTIQLTSMRSLTLHSGADIFVSGLGEELEMRLFQQFGPCERCAPPHFRVEVSIRLGQRHARASIRLFDVNAARIAWVHQCDRHGDLGIGLQEDLALAICDDLQSYMTGPGHSWDRRNGRPDA
jgi:hypothetical protein